MIRALWVFLTRLLAGLVLVAAAIWIFAPKEPIVPDVAFDPASIPSDLDGYLAQAEDGIPNLTDGVAKRVIWAGEAGKKTELSVVYLHGFSATSEEIRPVPDRVAQALGANLYYTRLRGHGRDGPAMAEARAGDWVNDTAEALEIGRRIGDRVVVISTSTGGTLATLAATDGSQPTEVVAQVFFSPNYGLNSPCLLYTSPSPRDS